MDKVEKDILEIRMDMQRLDTNILQVLEQVEDIAEHVDTALSLLNDRVLKVETGFERMKQLLFK